MSATMFRSGRTWKNLAATLFCALSCAACGTLGLDLDAGGPRTELRDMLTVPQGQSSPLQTQVLSFYAARGYRPAWTGSEEARERAASVMYALQHAEKQGLRPADYRVDPAAITEDSEADHAALAFDVRLTTALLQYANDLRRGRIEPKSVYSDAVLPTEDFNAAAELKTALKKGRVESFLAELPPQDQQYRALTSALARYRTIATKGGWDTLSNRSTPQKLAKRLAWEDGEFAKIKRPSAGDIKDALKRFQRRHDLPEDGVLGEETVKALNVPVSRRIAEISANMERWRWLPRQFEERYIRVDVPSQSVDFIEKGKSVLHSKVIIGKDGDDRTPILRAPANAIVVNPPWNIPDDIAAKAILPHLRKDPNYLASRNMVLVDAPDPTGAQIDWQEVKGDNLPYQIQQQPGPHNVLGALMLDMPNDFDVYLHGSSNPALFGLRNRERSHGCVRVQDVVGLAALALKGSVDKPKDALTQQISSGETQRMALSRPMPVYLLYWTAYVDKDGAVGFRPDRYDRDLPLIARLKGGKSESNREARLSAN